MDSSTPSPLLPNETFLVYRFALVATESERPTQKIVKVGEFNSAEDALDLARDHAVALAATHTSAVVSGAKDGAAENSVRIVPSEWGYDVKRDYRTLARFWVYSRAA